MPGTVPGMVQAAWAEDRLLNIVTVLNEPTVSNNSRRQSFGKTRAVLSFWETRVPKEWKMAESGTLSSRWPSLCHRHVERPTRE